MAKRQPPKKDLKTWDKLVDEMAALDRQEATKTPAGKPAPTRPPVR